VTRRRLAVLLTVTIAAGAGCADRRAPKTAPAKADNRPPSVRLRCEPCRVAAGASASVVADAIDPDGDVVSFRWSAAAGKVVALGGRIQWTAPSQEGPVPITVEVTDGRGGFATDAITLQVQR